MTWSDLFCWVAPCVVVLLTTLTLHQRYEMERSARVEAYISDILMAECTRLPWADSAVVASCPTMIDLAIEEIKTGERTYAGSRD